MILSVAVVAVFEFLSLAGWHLPPAVGAPFFVVIILAIGCLFNKIGKANNINHQNQHRVRHCDEARLR